MRLLLFLFIFNVYADVALKGRGIIQKTLDQVSPSINEKFGNDIIKDCKKNPFLGHFYSQSKYSTSSAKEDMIILNWGLYLGERARENLPGGVPFDKNYAAKNKEWVKKNCRHLYGQTIQEENQSLFYRNIIEPCSIHKQEEKTYYDCRFMDKLKIRKKPFAVSKLTGMMKEVIHQEWIETKVEPSVSKTHEWSPEHLEEINKEFPATKYFSKPFYLLMAGRTYQFMKTGNEVALTDWILSQPKESIYPDDLFRISLRMNQGDVYKAMLTIENILSYQWFNKDRSSISYLDNLASIIYSCDGNEDKFGSWYHLFGIMFYGCISGKSKAYQVAKIENLGSRVLDLKKFEAIGQKLFHLIFGTDLQEEKLGMRGAIVGDNVCDFVKSKQFKKYKGNINRTKPEEYLRYHEKIEGQ